MFYLMDFLRDLIINGIKMTFDLVKKVLNQLQPEQFNESLMRAVKEFMYQLNYDWNDFKVYLKSRSIPMVGVLFSAED